VVRGEDFDDDADFAVADRRRVLPPEKMLDKNGDARFFAGAVVDLGGFA
jgi:hypothetical protein